MLWETLITTGALGLAAIPIGRYLYIRFYLSDKLFFEAWVNLSRNETFEIGGGLAELLFFELEAIRRVLEEARSKSARLWNEKSAIPWLERSSGGYPEFVRHTEMLGLSGRVTNLVRLVLLTRPPAIRGTIHQYGSAVRFQVVLESLKTGQASLPSFGRLSAVLQDMRARWQNGRVSQTLPETSSERLKGGAEHPPVPCWAVGIQADEPHKIPDAVSDLAHSIALAFEPLDNFKAPQSFRCFTSGLRQHLAYNKLRHRNLFEEARTSYQSAIELEGGNAAASCNLGDLLYNQFTFQENEDAIEAYQSALKTEKAGIRARGFIGLANAYCQQRQRHRRGNIGSSVAALRFAGFASDLCKTSGLDKEDEASIKKAAAYAQQVWAEEEEVPAEQRKRALDRAVILYKDAIELNPEFTAAFNNLSNLYLNRAEAAIKRWRKDPARQEALETATTDLKDAEHWCALAIQSKASFHFAHDTRGNIARAKALTGSAQARDAELAFAIQCYHRALSYEPRYVAAHSDLAKVHARLLSLCEPGAGCVFHEEGASSETGMYRMAGFNRVLVWQHHWDALACTPVSDMDSKSMMCRDFSVVRSEYGVEYWKHAIEAKEVRSSAVNCTCVESQHARL